MKNIKHTPGPWSFEMHGGDFQVNAELHAICTSVHCYADEKISNAKLIAAAPDLLDALEAIILEHDDTYDGESMSIEKYEAFKKAERAIEKVRL